MFLAGAGTLPLASLAFGGRPGRKPAGGSRPRRPWSSVSSGRAFSLFVLTTGSFSSGGYASFEDRSTDAEFNVYNLPARTRFNTGLLGPLEMRLALGYGEATTSGLGIVEGGAGPTGDALASDRQFLRTWNARIEVGRPIELAPDLVLLPLAGLGYSNWTGKSVRTSVGTVRGAGGPGRFLGGCAALRGDRHPGIPAPLGRREHPPRHCGQLHLHRLGGRPRARHSGAARRPPRTGEARTLRVQHRAARGVRVDGPLGFSVAGNPLRWQTFAVGNYETAAFGLFPWSVETGVAVGADLDRLGRRLIGFDPGEFFVGVSYFSARTFPACGRISASGSDRIPREGARGS